MKTRKAKWTRGPVHHGTQKGYNAGTLYADKAGDSDYAIAQVFSVWNNHRIDDPELLASPRCAAGLANASLIAAAFNAATALEDQGYDGMETIKALPEIILVLRTLEVASSAYLGEIGAEIQKRARALLARIKETNP